MTIEVELPDGSIAEFPDGTPQTVITNALKQHMAKPATAAAPDTLPVTTNRVVRSVATGVPVLGGLANKLNAATNAFVAPVVEPFLEKGPDTLDQPTFSERYAKSLEIQNAADKRFAEESPVVDTAAKIAGGVGGTIPLVMAAPRLMGAAGTLPQMITRGAASGAALSGADAAVRGEDIEAGAGIGGAVGAAAPLVARGIGAAVRAVRPTPPPVPQNTVRVGNTEVPLSTSQVTGDAAASADEQVLLRGGRGEPAQRAAQEFQDLQNTRIAAARDEIEAGLDPSRAAPRTPPQAAGERVITELTDAEQRGVATEAIIAQRVADERAALNARLGGQGGAVLADSPFAASEAVGARVGQAAAEARTARTAAYREAAEVPGEYSPAALTRIGTSIRNRLSAGDNPVRVTDALTPRAAQALQVLDENVGTLRFRNDVQTGELIMDASGRPVPRPITGQTIDEARKELTTLYGDARRAAMAPGGSQADVRAMDRIIKAFDDHLTDAGRAGAFSGDVAALEAAQARARASHAAYRRTFTPQGAGDDVGRAVEKILGRYEGQGASPDEIARLSYGAADNPGGGQAIRVAQRLRGILGEASPEWGAYRQGLFSALEGNGNTPTQIAERIDRFLGGTHGRGLAQVVMSADERAALQNYANNLRWTEPVPLSALNSVDRIVARFSGRDGSLPASAGEVVDYLFGRTGKGDRGISVQLAQRLRNELSPEGWTAVRQGMWSKLTNAGEGKIEFGPQALSQRLHEFLNESGAPLARVLFTAPERQQMTVLANTYRQMIPVAGTTNPSGTAPMLAKIANKASSNLLAMLGAASSGFSGLALGWAADKGLRGLANARGTKDATRLFYGNQGRPPVSTSRVPIVLGQGVAPQLGQ